MYIWCGVKHFAYAILCIMKRGFTIVELLVVIVVIAILATASVLVYSGVRERAIRAQVQAAVGAMEKFAHLYYASTGSPLQINPQDANDLSLNYEPSNNMIGACIGSLPSDAEISDATGRPIPTDSVGRRYFMMFYCLSKHSNQNGMHSGDVEYLLYDRQITAAGMTDSVPAMPHHSAVTMSVKWHGNASLPGDAGDSSGPPQRVVIRGVRYAFNMSQDNPTSYLYYALPGKSCLKGDQTTKYWRTFFVGHDIAYAEAHMEFGGDYTFNDTAYCARKIAY